MTTDQRQRQGRVIAGSYGGDSPGERVGVDFTLASNNDKTITHSDFETLQNDGTVVAGSSQRTRNVHFERAQRADGGGRLHRWTDEKYDSETAGTDNPATPEAEDNVLAFDVRYAEDHVEYAAPPQPDGDRPEIGYVTNATGEEGEEDSNDDIPEVFRNYEPGVIQFPVARVKYHSPDYEEVISRLNQSGIPRNSQIYEQLAEEAAGVYGTIVIYDDGTYKLVGGGRGLPNISQLDDLAHDTLLANGYDGIPAVARERALDKVQLALDGAGFIPGPIGVVADLSSVAVSLYRGNYGEALFSFAAAIPGAGDAFAAVKSLRYTDEAGSGLRLWGRFAKAGKVDVAPKITGGRILDVSDLKSWDAAEDIYRGLRGTTEDINEIVRNSGLNRATVERVKEHLFNKTHLLDDGVRHFDADPSIANAWQRLRDGVGTADDFKLFKHEQAESILEQLIGGAYRQLHDAVSRRWPSGL